MKANILHYFDINEANIEKDRDCINNCNMLEETCPECYGGRRVEYDLDLDKYHGERMEIHWNEDNVEINAGGIGITYPKSRVHQYGDLPMNYKRVYGSSDPFTFEEILEILEDKATQMGIEVNIEVSKNIW